MKYIVSVSLSFLLNQLCAQMPSYMKLIKGGTFQANSGYAFYYKDSRMMLLGKDSSFNCDDIAIGEKPAFNTLERQVTVSDFYLSDHEVTNEEYLEFLLDSVMKLPLDKSVSVQLMDSVFWEGFKQSCQVAGLLPDIECWSKFNGSSYEDPMDMYYLRHVAYRKSPVAGVSWLQAKVYCVWLTRRMNRNGGQFPSFRLPTEMEWEYACNARKVKNGRTEYERPFPPYQLNIKTANGDYSGDEFTYPAPVRSFKPNENGLYDMRGNVAEWCEDLFRHPVKYDDLEVINHDRRNFQPEVKHAEDEVSGNVRVVKGGSWADYYDATLSGSRAYWEENGHSARIGFRVAMIKVDLIEENKK